MSASNKEPLREQMVEWREHELGHSDWVRKSRAVCRRLLGMPEISEADKILGIAPVDREVRLESFYIELPESVEVSLPKTVNRTLIALRVFDREGLVDNLMNDTAHGRFERNEHNILEPVHTESKTVSLPELDVVLVPGLVFDPSGNRIGYGEGYYDRYLSSRPTEVGTVGLCFEKQVMDTTLPVDNHDVAVDRVVTEDGIH